MAAALSLAAVCLLAGISGTGPAQGTVRRSSRAELREGIAFTGHALLRPMFVTR